MRCVRSNDSRLSTPVSTRSVANCWPRGLMRRRWQSLRCRSPSTIPVGAFLAALSAVSTPLPLATLELQGCLCSRYFEEAVVDEQLGALLRRCMALTRCTFQTCVLRGDVFACVPPTLTALKFT